MCTYLCVFLYECHTCTRTHTRLSLIQRTATLLYRPSLLQIALWNYMLSRVLNPGQPRIRSLAGWLAGWQAGKGHGTTETFPGASSRLLPACHSACSSCLSGVAASAAPPHWSKASCHYGPNGNGYKMNFICSRGGPSLSPMKISDGQSKACSSNRLICNGPQFLLFLYIFCVSSHTLSIDCFIWKH